MQKPFQKNDLCIKNNSNMLISEKLSCLRSEMKKHGIDAYIIPSSDPHQSEYVADHWKSREWISGFDGSAGTVVVTHTHAGLWTDSRYFLQAEEQLSNSEFVLHKIFDRTTPNHIAWLSENLDDESTIGIDGNLCSRYQKRIYQKKINAKGHTLNTSHDLIDPVWKDRPPRPLEKAFILEKNFTGLDINEKLKKIRKHVCEQNADGILITGLDEISWALNLRSNDIEFNPLCISFLLIEMKKATLFVDQSKVDDVKSELAKNRIEISDYESINAYLKALNGAAIMIDESTCNINLFNALGADNAIISPSIVTNLKGNKNEAEISNLRFALIKDGVALCHAFHWLENNINIQTVTEFDFSEKLTEYRSHQHDFKGESFSPIVGFADNGAVIHYRPVKETAKQIKSENILLCDSGGQFIDGTTDITRTIALGTPTSEQIKNNTLVLKGHIALAAAKFPKGTTGVQLDILARQALWSEGKNFLHGTGHGVGFFLNVHEGPQGFTAGPSSRGNTKFEAGMVTSNEPGYYVDGEYGIRIENLILCTESSFENFLEFETISFFPFDRNLINKSMLSEIEIDWVNDYHRKVWDLLSPHLPEEIQNWLEPQCKAL